MLFSVCSVGHSVACVCVNSWTLSYVISGIWSHHCHKSHFISSRNKHNIHKSYINTNALLILPKKRILTIRIKKKNYFLFFFIFLWLSHGGCRLSLHLSRAHPNLGHRHSLLRHRLRFHCTRTCFPASYKCELITSSHFCNIIKYCNKKIYAWLVYHVIYCSGSRDTGKLRCMMLFGGLNQVLLATSSSIMVLLDFFFFFIIIFSYFLQSLCF